MTSQLPPEAQLFPDPDQRPSTTGANRSNVIRIGAFAAIALCFVGVLSYVLMQGDEDAIPAQPVMIEADASPIKVRPEQPGGQNIPYQDVTIYEKIAAESEVGDKQLERIPLDLKAPEPGATTPTPAPEQQAAAPASAPEQQAPASQQQVTTESVPAATAPAQPEVAKTEAPAAEPKTAGPDKNVRMQLAAFPEKDKATGELARLQRKLGGILGKTKLTVVTADVPGKGVFYRVQSQPVLSSRAEKMCAAIKDAKAGCLIVK